MFFEVKMDAETKQYKIGTEVRYDSPPAATQHTRTPSGTIKLTLASEEPGKNLKATELLKLMNDEMKKRTCCKMA